MKLTKKLEAEVLERYHAFWDASLKGEMETMGQFLDDDIIVYGSAAGEIFSSKKEALRFYKAAADQTAGRVDFRNRQIILKAIGETVVLNEQCDLYVLMEGSWTFYGHARITSIFEQKGNTWKLVHHHASLPDSRTEEGEQLNTDKIKAENIQLKEAVKRRTLELEEKNKELEVEAALERVRGKAMAMHNSNDILATTSISFEELKKLGIHSIRCGIGLLSKNSMEAKVYASATDSTGAFQTMVGKRDMNEHPSLIRQYQNWLKQENSVEAISDEELRSYYSLLFFKGSRASATPEKFDKKQYGYYFPFAEGLFYSWSDHPYTEHEINILDRFKAIMALTFRRFLDLQKAEAQTREAQIELGLERVRARAMAMQHSDELAELVATVFRELNHLDFSLASCIIWIHNPAEKTNTLWIASDEMNKPAKPLEVVPFYPPFFNSIVPAWKAKDPKWIFSLTGTEKKKFEKLFFKEYPELPDELKKPVSENKQITFSASFNNFGALEVVATVPLTDDKFEILHRFGKVFDSSYTRFNDLKKAEAQAREAQIEASMERVRSRTMAMQKSAELMDVAVLLYNELKHLGVTQQFFETGYVEIDEVNKIQTGWTTTPDGNYLEPFYLPLNGEPVLDARYEAWKQRVPVFKQLVGGDELKRTIEFTLPYMGNKEAEEITRNAPDSIIFYCGNFEHGYLSINSDTLLGAEAEALLARFTRVFEMTYKRFLDLKKAEAQTREAQVEAALEKVRSRSLAMHKSEELADLSLEVVKQVQILGVPTWFCAFNIYDDDAGSSLEWGSNGQGTFAKYRTPREGIFLRYYEAGQKGETLLINEIGKDECAAHYEYLCSLPGVGEQLLSMKAAGIPFPTYQIDHVAFFKYGYIIFITYEPVPETHEIFKRFAKVFEQSYTRFLDLQKAEAQAREAQIEAALERVRSRSLAMHHTNELQDVVNVAAQQLLKMNIDMDGGMFIAINDEVTDDLPFWAAAGAADYVQKVTIPFLDKPTFTGLHDAILRRQPFYTEYYSKEEKDEFLKHLFRHHPWNQNSEARKQDLLAREGGYARSLVVNRYTTIGITNHHGKIFSDADNTVLKRFGAVLEQSYTRFLDLQKAEAQTREAQIEAALERVRSRTLAMQKSEELGDVAAVLFQQMNQLVTNLWTCGFVLCEKNRDEDEWWLSMDGDFTRGFFLPNVGDYAHSTLYEGWLNGDTIRAVQLEGEALQQHYDWLMEIPVSRRIFEEMDAAGLARPDWQKLHAAYFSKGYLVLITREPCGEEEIFKRFAAVFNLTYTRFNDLQIAEAHAVQAEQDLIAIKEAKQKAEQALTELQSTQKQLIQAEKMASLGELTAGIAHEIQNPLNFVNNFSEVNKELLAEMREEIEKGNLDEVKAIVNDMSVNEEKISEHGRRADAIVKGMLQHSRSSSGEKESTNINALADEYLRLAYHGLKAKDRSFNATIKTDFDQNIGNINIIPQDIGRVLLNLINNAFYAVNEKKKQIGESYEPEVTVVTRLINDSKNSLIISVKDNGNGIPDAIKEKIFQPFFTTKPTGQGTGLGLSLSYDIVKAHGGELKLETRDGQGCEFIIQLPISVN